MNSGFDPDFGSALEAASAIRATSRAVDSLTTCPVAVRDGQVDVTP
jgi:hypothetical protein